MWVFHAHLAPCVLRNKLVEEAAPVLQQADTVVWVLGTTRKVRLRPSQPRVFWVMGTIRKVRLRPSQPRVFWVMGTIRTVGQCRD